MWVWNYRFLKELVFCDQNFILSKMITSPQAMSYKPFGYHSTPYQSKLSGGIQMTPSNQAKSKKMKINFWYNIFSKSFQNERNVFLRYIYTNLLILRYPKNLKKWFRIRIFPNFVHMGRLMDKTFVFDHLFLINHSPHDFQTI